MCCAPTLGYHGQPPGAPWGSPLSPMGPHLGSLMETPRGTPWERLGETKGGPGECPAAALGNPLNPGWRKLKTHQKIKSFNPGAPVEPRGGRGTQPFPFKGPFKAVALFGPLRRAPEPFGDLVDFFAQRGWKRVPAAPRRVKIKILSFQIKNNGKIEKQNYFKMSLHFWTLFPFDPRVGPSDPWAHGDLFASCRR